MGGRGIIEQIWSPWGCSLPLLVVTNGHVPQGSECTAWKWKPFFFVSCQLLGVIEYFERNQYIKIGICLVPYRSDLSPLFSFKTWYTHIRFCPPLLLSEVDINFYKKHSIDMGQMMLNVLYVFLVSVTGMLLFHLFSRTIVIQVHNTNELELGFIVIRVRNANIGFQEWPVVHLVYCIFRKKGIKGFAIFCISFTILLKILFSFSYWENIL